MPTRLSRTLDLPLLWLPTTATCGSSKLKSVVTCGSRMRSLNLLDTRLHVNRLSQQMVSLCSRHAWQRRVPPATTLEDEPACKHEVVRSTAVPPD